MQSREFASFYQEIPITQLGISSLKIICLIFLPVPGIESTSFSQKLVLSKNYVILFFLRIFFLPVAGIESTSSSQKFVYPSSHPTFCMIGWKKILQSVDPQKPCIQSRRPNCFIYYQIGGRTLNIPSVSRLEEMRERLKSLFRWEEKTTRWF